MAGRSPLPAVTPDDLPRLLRAGGQPNTLVDNARQPADTPEPDDDADSDVDSEATAGQ